jgi:phosphoacetylglucosamine mutase
MFTPCYSSELLLASYARAASFLDAHRSYSLYIPFSFYKSYNGVKYAAADGGMMEAEGEALATLVVNTREPDQVLALIRQQKQSQKTTATIIHVGRDTRSHSDRFAQLVIQGALATDPSLTIVNHGVVTTPMLHHAVMHSNWQQYLPCIISPRQNVTGYLEILAHSYHALLGTRDMQQSTLLLHRPKLIIDCACGVGYAAAQALHEKLLSIGCPDRFSIVNPPGAGPLNEHCGSEHVQKALQPPTYYTNPSDRDEDGSYSCSLDGDADRIVFFSRSPFILLDGDKMASLICLFVQQQLGELQAPIRVGVVQTAYANGASTDFLQQLMGESSVAIAKTGVKYVHAAAHQFDVGIYFEANGHGTIVFGDEFYEYVATCKPIGPAACTALARLRILPSLVNQAVGDALSDLLLVDAILSLQNMSLQKWDSMYTDLPSRQLKVRVKDRSLIKVNDNETKCLEPAQVQIELQNAMQSVNGRAFVRPSGTEDVVRIYAEAPTRQAADELASKAAEIVNRLCGGVEETPGSKL